MQNLYDTLKNKRKQLGLSLRDAAKLKSLINNKKKRACWLKMILIFLI